MFSRTRYWDSCFIDYLVRTLSDSLTATSTPPQGRRSLCLLRLDSRTDFDSAFSLSLAIVFTRLARWTQTIGLRVSGTFCVSSLYPFRVCDWKDFGLVGQDTIGPCFSLVCTLSDSDFVRDSAFRFSDSASRLIRIVSHRYKAKLRLKQAKLKVYKLKARQQDKIRLCSSGIRQQEPLYVGKIESGQVFKYKPVDRKVKAVPGQVPLLRQVARRIPEDPMDSLPPLSMRPPEFTPTGRLTEENIAKLQINVDGNLWPEEVKLFMHILAINNDALAFDDSQRGTFKESYFTDYQISTIPHLPWEENHIPIPPALKEQVNQVLQAKIDAGVYEPAQSSYRSRWFCVPKKNGKLRIVHDLQRLNGITIREAGIPPNLDEFVEPFAGRQCNTVFDLFSGFDARRLHENSRDLTAFQTPLGQLRITVMPQGFTNSPAEFQECVTFILRPEIVKEKANIFIDDLAIRGPKSSYPDEHGNPAVLPENPGIRRFIWEHANDVHRVIHRVKSAGGTFNPSKAQIASPKVLILGQTCSPEGRIPDENKAEKILEWKPPTNTTEVRGFLGLCGTVRIWIKNYSELARPLTELVRKDEEFIWDTRRQQAFEELKRIVSEAPALRPIDYNSGRPIILSVDSSYIASGFILSQLDEDGFRRPARYGSLPMNEVESRYSQPKLELYGLYRALKHFALYIIGAQNFFVEIDAQYIKGMLKRPDLQPSASVNRWIQGILMFDFTLVHVPGRLFTGPDGLSRREPNPWDFVTDDDTWVDGSVETLQSHQIQATQESLAFVASTDSELLEIIEFLQSDTFPRRLDSERQQKRFAARALQFILKDGEMYRKRRDLLPQKVLLNNTSRRRCLKGAHDQAGHRGIEATYESLRLRFYWPKMREDTEKYVKSCLECQKRSPNMWHLPITISAPSGLWKKVYIDIMYMPKAQGFRYIVAARDDLSRVSEGRALRAATAKSLCEFFWEQLYCRYGAIEQVVTDNGGEVQGAFSRLLDRMDIPQVKISPYNSQANGVVERGHWIIREAILKACNGKTSEWPRHVSAAFFADRITVTRSTGYSPYYLLHGSHPTLPLDLAEMTFLGPAYNSHMTTADLLAHRIRQLAKLPADIKRAAGTLKTHRLRSKEAFERRFFKRLIRSDHLPGSLVLVRNTAIRSSMNKKEKPRYLGPYRVLRRTYGGSYVLAEPDGAQLSTRFAAFRVIPYISRDGEELRKLSYEELENSGDEFFEEPPTESTDTAQDDTGTTSHSG